MTSHLRGSGTGSTASVRRRGCRLLVEAVRRRSEGLGLLRAVASEAHKLATDAAAHQEELRRDAIVRQAAVDAGLDGEQLDV